MNRKDTRDYGAQLRDYLGAMILLQEATERGDYQARARWHERLVVYLNEIKSGNPARTPQTVEEGQAALEFYRQHVPYYTRSNKSLLYYLLFGAGIITTIWGTDLMAKLFHPISAEQWIEGGVTLVTTLTGAWATQKLVDRISFKMKVIKARQPKKGKLGCFWSALTQQI